MKRQTYLHTFLVALILLTLVSPVTLAFQIPLTGDSPTSQDNAALDAKASMPSLRTFAGNIQKGNTTLLTGVYIPGVLANKVVQQPSSNAGYVSALPETITQFRMASNYKTTGLLAHDYLAGSAFFNIKVGQDVVLLYGNGVTKYYQVAEIQRYQALSPLSPYSNFVDQVSGKTISAQQLFYRTYGLGNLVVLQTCISTEKVSSWGRIFILARPVAGPTPTLAQAAPLITRLFSNMARSFTTSLAKSTSRVALQ